MTVRDRLAAIVAPLPAGASVSLPADALRAWLDEDEQPAESAPPPFAPAATSMRERLWTVPAETRLDVGQAAEALGRSRSWLYKATSAKPAGLPFHKLGG